jgi:transcriptional regulator with XRE-family HTH domain
MAPAAEPPAARLVEGALELSMDADRAGTPLGVFGAELRYYRTRAGLSQTDLAAKAYMSHDVISKIETGERAPSEGTPERLDAVPELDTRDGLTRLWNLLRPGMRHRAHPGWFQRWATDVEVKALLMRWFEPVLVPGILQTEDYARALLADRIGSTLEEVEASVSARMGRQAILDRDRPPELWFVIDEASLHRGVGGAYVMREQMRHLIEMSQRSAIVLQVIPSSVAVHDGLRGAGFTIADLEDSPRVAYQDTAVRGQIVDDRDDVAVLMGIWDRLRAEALPRKASLTLIEEVAKTWT